MHPELATHDHVCLLYRHPDEMRQSLVQFTEEGIERQELVVFVHAFPDETRALAFLDRSGFAFRDLLRDRFFLVSFYEEAFEGGRGSIDVAHVGKTVEALLAEAARQRRGGVRLFVDASRVYLDEGRAAEWFAFESALGRRLHQRISLVCAYLATTVESPERQAALLETHLYRLG